MIRANCRARFTAADFDFVVRTLARSQTDHVSLVDLLSDVETRDSILDHPRLVEAILSNCEHLRISSQFCFGRIRAPVVTDNYVGQKRGLALVFYKRDCVGTDNQQSQPQETHHVTAITYRRSQSAQ